MSDADFVQSTQKEELSLDQAVNLGNCESHEFHVIRFGSSIIMRSSAQFAPFFLPSSGQGVYQARVQITQILHNSFWLQVNHANSA